MKLKMVVGSLAVSVLLIAMAHAKEMLSPSGPQDWTSNDRNEWQSASMTLDANGLKQYVQTHNNNTFLLAAKNNILNLRSSEYTSVSQRNSFYDYVSYLIEFETATPVAIKDVRFFHATTVVTRSPGLATVEAPAGKACLSEKSRQYLTGINEVLFRENLSIIKNLFYGWKSTRNPLDQVKSVSNFEFDLKMVEFEQSAVEAFLGTHTASKEVVVEINAMMNGPQCPKLYLPRWVFFFLQADQWIQWAKEAIGSDLNFQNKVHRMAVGKAAVFIFHGKTKAEYLAHIRV